MSRTVNPILVGAGVFAVLVAVVGTGLRAGVFQLGLDSKTSEQLQKSTTRTVLFVVGVGFLLLAVATREQSSSDKAGLAPPFQLPTIPNPKDFRPTEAKLELSRHSGPPGTRLRVTASGFEPGEIIEIVFHTTTLQKERANPEGVIREVLVQIPTDWDFKGPFDIIADGQSSIKHVEEQFTVK